VAELGRTNLPAASVAQLATGAYTTLNEVQAAVTAEVARLKAAGSGQPFGITEPPVKAQQSLSEIQAALQAVNHKWLGGSHNG
jgi:hypothetical protein